MVGVLGIEPSRCSHLLLSSVYKTNPRTCANAKESGADAGGRSRWFRLATWHATRRVPSAYWWNASESNRA